MFLDKKYFPVSPMKIIGSNALPKDCVCVSKYMICSAPVSTSSKDSIWGMFQLLKKFKHFFHKIINNLDYLFEPSKTHGRDILSDKFYNFKEIWWMA